MAHYISFWKSYKKQTITKAICILGLIYLGPHTSKAHFAKYTCNAEKHLS